MVRRRRAETKQRRPNSQPAAREPRPNRSTVDDESPMNASACSSRDEAARQRVSRPFDVLRS